ncbi:AsmA family protein [Novosphingobium sp. BL-8H]|uniref:AsmA family protein n=1 Tax=Novosphingobium sp. BL-8H TaxID=3127640 RepID=UPI003756EDF2
MACCLAKARPASTPCDSLASTMLWSGIMYSGRAGEHRLGTIPPTTRQQTMNHAAAIPIIRKISVAALAVLICLFLLIALFPVSWLKNSIEDRLGDRIGSPVTIASMDRETYFSLNPVIRVADVRVAQAPWAGPGNMATIGLLRLKLHAISLLSGAMDAQILSARGIRLNLARDAEGRKNWARPGSEREPGNGAGMAIASIDDAAISYRDALQKHSFSISVQVTPEKGLTANGTGQVDGAPVQVAIKGGVMATAQPWPFDARIEGPALGVHAAGRMAGPLRFDDMEFRMTARADDLKRIDRIIEAGLFGTQPVDLAAQVTHRDSTWSVHALHGTIGNSTLAGSVTARKQGERTKLDGQVRFARLDFDDLASDAGNARALQLEQAQGLRLVPNTRINIRKIDKTDGRIAVTIDHVVGGRRPSSITDLSAVLRLENRVLTVDPLRIGLKAGVITGKAVVDQRNGQAAPRVTIALDMKHSDIPALAGGGSAEVTGRIDGRLRLAGTGSTIREVIGNADGSIGLVAQQGSLPTRIAALIGFDIGKGLLGDDAGRSTLRCGILKLDMRGGRGTVDPLLIDTSESQSRGTGTVTFPDEQLALTLNGMPKADAALRLPGPISVSGTIRNPAIVVPRQSKSVGAIVKMIGRAITGKSGPVATDADCAGLIRATLGT